MTTFDTTTAYSRLRAVLAASEANPRLLPPGVGPDVHTVLQEHAAMTAELADTQRRFDALVTSDKAKQGAADWMLNRLHDDKLIDKDTYTSLCGLLRDQIDATRNLTHSEDWGPLTDRYRAAVERAKDAEAERDRLAAELAKLEAKYADTGDTHRELLARTYCALCGNPRTSTVHITGCLTTEGARP